MNEVNDIGELRLAKLRRLRELRERAEWQAAEKYRTTDVFGDMEYTPTPKQQIFHEAKEFDVLFGGSLGGGKGGRCPDRTAPSYDSSMETKVLTPKGFKLFGDVRVGDQVCNPDGTVARVIKVTDNGPKQFYRVTLADGSSVEADEDHLWAVAFASRRKRRKHAIPTIPEGLRPEDEWNLRVQTRCRVINTVELRRLVQRAEERKAAGWVTPGHVLIPLTNPVNLTGAKGRWERFSPYILGALVGDGHLGGRMVTITSADQEVLDRIRAELPGQLELRNPVQRGKAVTFGIHLKVRQGQRTESSRTAFGEGVVAAREAQGLAQAALVARSGITQKYLSQIERGQVWPSVEVARKIDEALEADGAIIALNSEHPGESAMTLLKRDGLHDRRSWSKFIPERIKLAPGVDRFAFVQGLMDTDGHMDARGHVEWTSVSERLARDLRDVLHSLGYRATLTTKTPTYTHDGEKREGRLAYRLHIQGRHMDRLFHLGRKRERVKRYNGHDVEPFHRVVSVEPTVVDRSKCITVDNLNHLYVTDDYIVTHNSLALLMESIRACVRNPGLRVGAFRRTFGELRETLIAELGQRGFARQLGAEWNGTLFELRFPNGSILMFRYAETLAQVTRWQGAQYQLLVLDERTLLNPDVVSFLESRLRSGRAKIPVLGIRSSANPGGPGHGAVRARYIEPTNYGENTYVDAGGRTVRFIQSKMSDNPHLNADYDKHLLTLPEAMRQALREGDWTIFSGQAFSEFKRDRNIVPAFEIPGSWHRYMGLDYGWTAPSVAIWGAKDVDGRLWLYRELTMRKTPEPEQARKILAAEQGEPKTVHRAADPAMWGRVGSAAPPAHQMATEGLALRKADNDRLGGWSRLHTYLADAPACAHHRELGWATCPMLHVLEGACPELVRTLPDLPMDPNRPEDIDTHGEDHWADALRYLIMSIGGGPSFPILTGTPGEPDGEPQANPHLMAGGLFAVKPSEDLFGDPIPPDLARDDAWRV